MLQQLQQQRNAITHVSTRQRINVIGPIASQTGNREQLAALRVDVGPCVPCRSYTAYPRLRKHTQQRTKGRLLYPGCLPELNQ